MSASYVRSKVEQWCNEVATVVGSAFHKTINVEANPTEDVWFTVEFTDLFHEGLLCRKGYLEQGAVRVVFISEPGIGWEDNILLLESVIPLLMEKVDPTRRLELTDYEPIVEESFGSAEPRYMTSVSINYIHQL